MARGPSDRDNQSIDVRLEEKRTSQVYFADYDYACLASYVTSLKVRHTIGEKSDQSHSHSQLL